MSRRFLLGLGALATSVIGAPCRGVPADYTDMPLKKLMDVEVTTVSRRPQTVRASAAAVTVLSREQIRRAGATTIPDALRLVPGISVTRINAGTWAISARGFTRQFANKLLVMIDGRPIFSPFFSGVVWNRHDLAIADIERIEVVRGPGGAVWGANAVNGVINIKTRHAGDTRGTAVGVSAGNVERGILTVSHAGAFDRGAYRVTGQGRRRDDGPAASGAEDDPWTAGSLRFRSDARGLGGRMRVVAAARRSHNDASVRRLDPMTNTRVRARGGSTFTTGVASLRWRRRLGRRSSLQGFAFYDHSEVDSPLFALSRDRLEVRVRHRFSPSKRHDVVWGFRARGVRESVSSTRSVMVGDNHETNTRSSVFVQDTIMLSNTVNLIAGAKLSHNTFTGVEVQPSLRALWNVTPRHGVWGAVSRAVRVPTRVESDTTVRFASGTTPRGVPIVTALHGHENVEAENLFAYELGYRGRPAADTRASVAVFYNDYTDLLALRPVRRSRSGQPPGVIARSRFTNLGAAEAYGVETQASWRASPNLRLTATYAFIDVDFDGFSGGGRQTTAPHQGTLRWRWKPASALSADATLRVRDARPGSDVDARAALDARVAWKPRPGLAVALTGRNLVNTERTAFEPGPFPGNTATAAERSIFASVRVRF